MTVTESILALVTSISTSIATTSDLLRLLVLPVFAWAAVRDIKTRRIPSNIWLPLLIVGAIALSLDALRLAPFDTFLGRLFLIQAGISLFFVAPLGYLFWRLGGFGGADAKALITIAVILPTFPTYFIGTAAYPLVDTPTGVFSFTVLTNTVILAAVIPLSIFLYNAAQGRLSSQTIFARPVDVESLPDRHGRLFETQSGFTRNGLDLDALRMYLRWRGMTLAELRSDPAQHRDPATITETFEPTDGGTAVGPQTDGGVVETKSDAVDNSADDPWGAARFLEEIDGTAYGTTPAMLREGLETIIDRDEIWVSPGFPFIVPMFLGLVVSFTYGDLLFGYLGWVGLF